MARSVKHPVPGPEVVPAPSAAPDCPTCRQQPLEDLPMYRYINPIPKPGEGAPCRGACPSRDTAAILAALEQQNNLLAELLASVTGLTAACLCRRPDHKREEG